MDILRFSKFKEALPLSENTGYSDFINLPGDLKKILTGGVSKNIFSKVIGNKNFKIQLEGDGVYFILNDNKVLFPFIVYKEGSAFLDQNKLKDIKNYVDINNQLGINDERLLSRYIIEKLTGTYGGPRFKTIEELFSGYLDYLFSMINDILNKEPKDFLNPFTLDLANNPVIRNLNALGISIVSSERQKKNGTIQFTADFLPSDLTVHTNGYMRRLSSTPAPITSNIELSRPIYTEDDLNLKLTYIYIYALKTYLKSVGMSSKIATSIAQAMANGDNSDYDELIKEISKQNPGLAHLLPDPNSVIDPVLVRGASILGRFNAF